ncbi:MAG: SsrA-binding protein [Desulfobacteraceae bacterium 4572_130]|nr:MAG: SsrA-binding protein [Desulfobacteraceae bacterium 4572_130]
MTSNHIQMIANNKKAKYNFFIFDEIEAGIVLSGTEVKSMRKGQVSIKDSYADISNGEVFLKQLHISPYKYAYYGNHEPLRSRKLLLHKFEIKRLIGKVKEKGFSIIPLKIYFKNSRVKIKIGLAKGKKLYDKRESIKQKDIKREMDRERKNY